VTSGLSQNYATDLSGPFRLDLGSVPAVKLSVARRGSGGLDDPAIVR
jgi:hypothetical protein